MHLQSPPQLGLVRFMCMKDFLGKPIRPRSIDSINRQSFKLDDSTLRHYSLDRDTINRFGPEFLLRTVLDPSNSIDDECLKSVGSCRDMIICNGTERALITARGQVHLNSI
jgi:hypothetical protein